MKGKINTILVGAGSPSEDDVKKMFGWSAHKFGQVSNLPEGHVYKEEAPKFDLGDCDPHWDKVVALLHFDWDFSDASGLTEWNAFGDARIEQGAGIHGTGSYYGDGRNDYIRSVNPHLVLGNLDFTLEGFTHMLGHTHHGTLASNCLVDMRTSEPSTEILLDAASSGRLRVFFNGSYVIDEPSASLLDGLTHWALTREGNVFRLFIDGALAGQFSYSGSLNSGALTLGGRFAAVAGDWRSLKGLIDEFRITKGVARYTENFMPPTEPFPNFGTSAPTLPTVIGEFFQGGYYIGDIEDQGKHYKILVAPIEADVYGLQWSAISSATAGTDSLTDGWSNTWSMNTGNHPAASHCLDYRGGGHDDWYMPAKNELNLFWLNIAPGKTQVPEFMTGGEQALHGSQYYWASTQYSSTHAWIQRFSDGTQNITTQSTTHRRVRPVRRIRKPD